MLVCMKNTALKDVSQDKHSTRLHLVLYLSFDMPPFAVFPVQTRSSALSNNIQNRTMKYNLLVTC